MHCLTVSCLSSEARQIIVSICGSKAARIAMKQRTSTLRRATWSCSPSPKTRDTTCSRSSHSRRTSGEHQHSGTCG